MLLLVFFFVFVADNEIGREIFYFDNNGRTDSSSMHVFVLRGSRLDNE